MPTTAPRHDSPTPSMRASPRVLFVTAEAVPLAKTGGLGDAITGLAQALADDGVDLTILLPAYRETKALFRDVDRVAHLAPDAALPDGATLLEGPLAGTRCRVVLVQIDRLYDRPGGVYVGGDGEEFADNGARFAALSHAAVRIAAGDSDLPRPDIVHAHDWHAGLVPWLMKLRGLPQPVLLTIHNLFHQGEYPAEQAAEFGLPAALHDDPVVRVGDTINFMHAGLRTADALTTVSDTYAREIQTPRFGHGLESVIRARADRLTAIRNGVDNAVWDPFQDPMIARRYDVRTLDDKRENKRELQRQFGLQELDDAPLLLSASRLAPQKMADLAVVAVDDVLRRHPRVQFVGIGRGEPALEARFRDLGLRWPGRAGVHVGYTEPLAHQAQAGADMLLHGSRFEPFGLTPVYALRYGTVPIVSRVGGMADTISEARGVLFDGETAGAMIDAIERALRRYEDREAWQKMQRAGMVCDFSWAAPSADYRALYQSLVSATPSGPTDHHSPA